MLQQLSAFVNIAFTEQPCFSSQPQLFLLYLYFQRIWSGLFPPSTTAEVPFMQKIMKFCSNMPKSLLKKKKPNIKILSLECISETMNTRNLEIIRDNWFSTTCNCLATFCYWQILWNVFSKPISHSYLKKGKKIISSHG